MDAVNRAEAPVEMESTSWTRRILVWVLPLAVASVAIYLYGSAGRFASTDNAYLQQDRVDVAAQISGNVSNIFVEENAHVKAGDPVVQLDNAMLRIAVAAAQSKLAAARADVATLKAAYREKLGEVDVARQAAEFTTRELTRQQELAEKKLVSASSLDATSRTATISKGAVGVLELQRTQTAARLGGNADLPLDSYPAVQMAIAEVDHAKLDLEHALIRAPQAGIASHLPKVGSRVEIGRAAFAVVADESLWVEANFKETDLEWVRPGQAVQIEVDTFAHHVWKGRVQSIAQATGAAFSLLPAQNATGNWVKVVQRIPVHITLELHADDPPLRNGMSANVEIDTGPHSRFDRWFGRKS
jgi:membrane fusion protein (multidrug efflux system)